MEIRPLSSLEQRYSDDDDFEKKTPTGSCALAESGRGMVVAAANLEGVLMRVFTKEKIDDASTDTSSSPKEETGAGVEPVRFRSKWSIESMILTISYGVYQLFRNSTPMTILLSNKSLPLLLLVF